MITGAALVDEARRWVGVPFVHQGRTRFGVDCIGLVICVRTALGPLPEVLKEATNYGRRARDGLLLERVATHCAPINVVEPGAIALIRWHNKQPPSHVIICTGEGTMIHAYRNVDRVCEVGYRSQWLRLTAGLYRLPGVSNE